MNSRTCLIFPGQGAQQPNMLAGVSHAPSFTAHCQLVGDVLKVNSLDKLMQNPEALNQNAVSSLLTVLTSSLSLELYLNSEWGTTADFLAGYSIGQWTALYAAKAISFEQLVNIIVERARLMDECIATQPSGMIAVIGVAEALLIAFCQMLQTQGFYLTISNYNAVGQYTLAGTEAALDQALLQLDSLSPKKYLRIPVSGAWHCSLLAPAAKLFQDYLTTVDFKPLQLPVVNNVTASLLPSEVTELKEQLAAHVCSPVRWYPSIHYLINQQCTQFIEIGYEKTLTKFGFFIDRSVSHQYFYNCLMG